MHSFSDAVVLITVLADAVVLVLGLVNMLRQGPGAPNRSQTFMRWRVGLQFLAVAHIVDHLEGGPLLPRPALPGTTWFASTRRVGWSSAGRGSSVTCAHNSPASSDR